VETIPFREALPKTVDCIFVGRLLPHKNVEVLLRAVATLPGVTLLVVGSGHSAFNAILDLATLAEDAPTTTILWAVRRQQINQLFGGGKRDQLPARGALGARIRELLADGHVRLLTGIQVRKLVAGNGGIVVLHQDGELPAVDEIISATGFRPDLSFLGEVRLGLDPAVQATPALAPLIDPNLHACGTVRPHGEAELRHPDEPGFYFAGMKSYGRAPTFLLATGHEQVRSIAAFLADDVAAARRVELVLPETGVCSTSPRAPGPSEPGTGCCGPAGDVRPAACCAKPAGASAAEVVTG